MKGVLLMDRVIVEASLKDEVLNGLKLIQFKNLELPICIMSVVAEVLSGEHWIPASNVVVNSTNFSRIFYNPMNELYINVDCNGEKVSGSISKVEEEEALNKLTYYELRDLGKQFSKKSVNFIRIFNEKEREQAEKEGKLAELMMKKNALIERTEAALRKTNHP